jgi:hypothetical protein
VKNTLIKRFVVVLAASLLAGSCFAADDPGDPNGGAPKEKEKKTPKQMVSSSVKASELPIPRIWIGLTGSYTPLRILKANANGLTDATNDSFTATTAQGQAGGGAILNARLFRGYWINIGAIYRFSGYDATAAYTDINSTVNTERSRVRLVDFPVMLRYAGKKWNPSKYTFYEIGGALRDGLSINTSTYSFNVNGPIGAGPLTGTKYRRTVPGAMAGVGLIGRDDFGIIVSPEVRYTRWMGDTFTSPLLGGQRNQLEVTVSFGF